MSEGRRGAEGASTARFGVLGDGRRLLGWVWALDLGRDIIDNADWRR